MNFNILSAERDIFGQWTVEISINSHKYKYELNDYDYNKAIQLYRNAGYGKALDILKKGELT